MLKAMFYGIPLATRREGVSGIRHAYRAVLDRFLDQARNGG
jgi:hypothetical protein